MNNRDTKIAHDLKDRLLEVGGDSVLRVIFFGSRVKGRARKDSDLDVAVVVRSKSDNLVASLDDAVYQIMWDHDFSPIISLKIFDRDTFDQSLSNGFSFYRQLESAGVEL